jgi:hypothetical protein
MFKFVDSIIEIDMRRFIDFEGRWRVSPEKLIDILNSNSNSYSQVLFNFLDCVDFEISGADSILRYVCKKCKLLPNNAIVALYDPAELEYASVFQGKPMALSSMIHEFRYSIDNENATKKFLALYNRTSMSRMRMAKFLQDNFSNDLILSCNSTLHSFYENNMYLQPSDGKDLENWIKHQTGPIQDITKKSVLETIELSSQFAKDYLIEVVMESNPRILRVVTEKTMRSFLFGKPFLVYAAPGFLKMLTDMGFKTFQPFINEDYDLIEDQNLRFAAIQQELLRLGSLPIETLKEQLKTLNNIFLHNQLLFRTRNFDLNKIKWSKNADFFDHAMFYQ